MSTTKILILIIVLAILHSLYFIIPLLNSQSSSPLIFRGYPDPKYQSLPVITLEELEQYNGEDNPLIFTAILNVVFDVTNSGFYTKQTGYDSFAGKDSTLMIAYWKAIPELSNLYNTAKYDELTDAQKGDVKIMFESTYQKKYKPVARIWFDELQAQSNQRIFKQEQL